MSEFWIDSNIYLRSRLGVLALDIAPRFWNHLANFGSVGRISSPVEVYNELLRNSLDRDPFNTWVKEHRNSLFTDTNDSAQRNWGLISDYVERTYAADNAMEFMAEADPWLIAHAIASGGRVVTNELVTREPGPSRNTGLINTKVRIPNVAQQFGVARISLPDMLRALGVNVL